MLTLGAGCADVPTEEEVFFESDHANATELQQQEEVKKETSSPVYPVEGYTERITEKWFGKYVQDRFTGYHRGMTTTHPRKRMESGNTCILGGFLTVFFNPVNSQ